MTNAATTVKKYIGIAIGITVLLVIVFGPPVYFVYLLVSGVPLWGPTVTETITYESRTGIIPTMFPIVVLWLMVLLIIRVGLRGPRL